MKPYLAAIAALMLSGCSSANLDYVKDNADERWRSIGYRVVGYEGYQWGPPSWGAYGGARVWFQLRREPDNGIAYSGFLVRWGDELMVYGPVAIDAIKPTSK